MTVYGAAGGQVTLYFTFTDELSGLPADPAALQLDLTYGSATPPAGDYAGPFTYAGASSPSPNTVWRVSTGQYAFTWSVPSSAPTGDYVATWTATYGGQQWPAWENLWISGVVSPAAPSADIGFWTGSIAYTPPSTDLAVYSGLTIPLGAVDANGTAWLLQKIDGWDSPDVQGAGVIAKSGDHGGWASPQFYAARALTLTVTAIAQTQALRDVARAQLQQAVPVSDLALFTFNEAIPKQAYLRRSGRISEAATDLVSVTFTIGAICPDPRKYGTVLKTAFVNAINESLIGVVPPFTVPFTLPAQPPAGSVAVTNAGTFESRPVITIQGPITSPALTNVQTGQTVSWTGLVLGATDQLVADFNLAQALLNGSYRPADLFSSWWTLPPGATSIQLGGNSGTGASMSVAFRDAWI